MSYYSDMILATPGLVSYWRLSEASGSVLDSKGTNHGAVAGGITRNVAGLLTGDADGAVQGNGVIGSYINVPNAASMDTTTAQLTVECWVKPAAADFRPMLGRFQAGSANWYIESAISDWGFWVRDHAGTDTGVYSGAAVGPSAGVRRHLVMTYTAGDALKAYVDGVLRGSEPVASINVNTNGNPIRMFANASTGAAFNGVIDEAAFYNVALTPAQIADHYNVGSTGAPAAVANPIVMVV